MYAAAPSDLVKKGSVKVVKENANEDKKPFNQFDPVYDWKNDKALQKVAEMLNAK